MKRLFRRFSKCEAKSPVYKADCILKVGHFGYHRTATIRNKIQGRGYYFWNETSITEVWRKLDG